MYRIKTLNRISTKGLKLFPQDKYKIETEISDPDAIILRSFDMHKMDLPRSLIAVGRAGVGVNNIPIEKCSEKGIVVFNTPGANANAVKELTIAGLFLASRDIAKGISFAKSLGGQGVMVPDIIESHKKHYVGVEIAGKTLGVIGLGKIGIAVANSALNLDMQVIGYDPFISIESAWGLSRKVERADSLDRLVAKVDYLSLHLPLTATTISIIDAKEFSRMKKGVRLLNFSRGAIVNDNALKTAIKNGTVARYVTDFPDGDLISMENVIAIPHLGASTVESEENCAIMVSKQLCNFIENGDIRNSVNFPACFLPRSSDSRLIVLNENIPNVVGQISSVLAKANINISEMLNKSKRDYACTIIDMSNRGTMETIEVREAIHNINGVLRTRFLGMG